MKQYIYIKLHTSKKDIQSMHKKEIYIGNIYYKRYI